MCWLIRRKATVKNLGQTAKRKYEKNISLATSSQQNSGAKIKIAEKHTFIHNWSLQPFSQDYWPSFSHHLCIACVNFIHKWRDLQFKADTEWQIFWETFDSNFIYSQNFCQKSAERKSPKKYFSYFILMSGLGLEPWIFI